MPDDRTTADPASHRVADHLREQILSGAISPGQRIRQEDVAEMFELSRLPVREALRMLAAEGLTELHPNRGARVPRLSMHEVDVVYRMREALEPLALAESMPHLTDGDVAELRDIQRDIESNDDIQRFLDWTGHSTSTVTRAARSNHSVRPWSACGTARSLTGAHSSH